VIRNFLECDEDGSQASRDKSGAKRLSLFAILALTVAIIVIAAAFGMTTTGCSSNVSPDSSQDLKAAIIDQLVLLRSNEEFISRTTQSLEDYGFTVDIYEGEAVTVDFYRRLPTYGYKLIIFRCHSGLLGVDPKIINRTWLFTAEEYSKTSHVLEQLDDQVTYAGTDYDDSWVFAVSAKFITQSTEAEFDKSVIIMMGCDAFHFTDLAEAFIQKGASTYIGWDFSVLMDYVDRATPLLVEKLCNEELTVEKAVTRTMQEVKPDPKYGSVLHYFPVETGNKTVNQLTK
jgi:hypothetical protein